LIAADVHKQGMSPVTRPAEHAQLQTGPHHSGPVSFQNRMMTLRPAPEVIKVSKSHRKSSAVGEGCPNVAAGSEMVSHRKTRLRQFL
jgi:hypothetical protein